MGIFKFSREKKSRVVNGDPDRVKIRRTESESFTRVEQRKIVLC